MQQKSNGISLHHGQFIKYTSVVNAKLEKRSAKLGGGQLGVFAKKLIKKGEIVMIQVGEAMSAKKYFSLSKNLQRYPLQIADDIFLGQSSFKAFDLAEYINHSCDPNLGILGNNIMVAMRNIKVGEEVCFDYAMSDTTEGDVGWQCHCGSKKCRGVVKSTDWKLPELQKRYGVYFSNYILEKINLI